MAQHGSNSDSDRIRISGRAKRNAAGASGDGGDRGEPSGESGVDGSEIVANREQAILNGSGGSERGNTSDGSDGNGASGGSVGDSGGGSRDGSENGSDGSGGSRDGTDGNSSVGIGANRRPGRHKRDCQCERCQTRREKRATASDFRIDADAPKRVGYETLINEKAKLNGTILTEVLGITVDALYSAPTYLLPQGTADHWPLTEPESKELVKRLEGVLDMLPKRRKSAMAKLLSRIGPPALLFGSAFLMTYPRVQTTRILLAQHRANARNRNGANAHTTQSASESANANTSGDGTDEPAGSDFVGNDNSTSGVARSAFSAFVHPIRDIAAI